MWWVIYIVRDNEWITTWQASLALRRTTEQKSVGWLCVSWNIFFYFKPTHLKHTTSAILMHTHTASPLSRLFLMKFLFPLSPVNLSFSADYMETLSNFQLNRPLVSAQNSQIFFFFSFPSHTSKQEFSFRHVCGLYIGLYCATRTWEGTSLRRWTAAGTRWPAAQMDPNPIYTSA